MQCVKSEPIFSHYYRKDYNFSNTLYASRSQEACSNYKSVQSFEHWSTVEKKEKLQTTPENLRIFDHKRKSDGSPVVRRRIDGRIGNSPKRYQNNREANASKYENWRDSDDPYRQMFLNNEVVGRNVNSNYNRKESPDKFVSWRDAGGDGVREKTENHEHQMETRQKEMNPSFKPSDVLEGTIQPHNHDTQTKKDTRNKMTKKRNRHKSAEVPLLWKVPDAYSEEN